MGYDQLAQAYGRHRRCNADVLRELANGAGLTNRSRVLEVGAGTGNYSRALRELTGCHCTAVEPSQAMRDLLREADGAIDVVRAVGEQMPLSSDSFDLVFCVDVAHHFTDPAAFLGEAFRVLKTAGVVCIVTDSEDIIRTRFPLAKYFPETVDADLSRYPAVDRLEGLASAAGFQGWRELRVTNTLPLKSLEAYETKSFSVLHLIPEASFQMGLARLRADFESGPLMAVGSYVLLWATK
jgi:SAM-dependent methyltransferase